MKEDELKTECLKFAQHRAWMPPVEELMSFAKRMQAVGRQDEHQRWVKKFPSASPPQGGGTP